MSLEHAFYITGSEWPKPASMCALYVDGTAGEDFRESVDCELSHWLPNKTEERYKTGTSTEICFNYLEANPQAPYDLVINNHLDGDGILSVFTLTHPQMAIKHKEVICNAAKASDFWAWSEGKAFILFQELSQFFGKIAVSDKGIEEAYHLGFSLILDVLQGRKHDTGAHEILAEQYSFIEQGKIIREELHQRLVHYHVPKSLSHEKRIFGVAAFNEPITKRLSFWPQVRNRFDQEKLHLISIETSQGIHYDLWYPGYCWADTRGLWRPPGLILPGKTGDLHELQWVALTRLVSKLNEDEPKGGKWHLFPGLDFANRKNTRNFPIVLSTFSPLNQKEGSALSLKWVKEAFSELLAASGGKV